MKIKVALFVNGWNGENVDSFIDGFNDYFKDDEVDLFVFTSYSQVGTLGSDEVNEAFNSIYSLPDISFFDAVMIFGSGIKSDASVMNIIKRSREADVPVIIQGLDYDDVSSVVVDSYIGMKNLCKHLIVDHNVKNATFIAGTKDNVDSNFRMEVLKETLEEYGYNLGDENIFYANWDAIQIKKYLYDHFSEGKEKLPDAFVCANDQMAIFVVLFLEEMGYRTPDDIIVTGFDSLGDGKVNYPSLATVDQSFMEQGRECAKQVVEHIANKKLIKKSVIPCVAVRGESCGCMECNGETELRKRIGQVWWNERYISDGIRIRENQFDMCLVSNERYEYIHQSMNENFLTTTGIESEDFHVYVNPQYKELLYLNVPEEGHKGILFSPVADVICAKTNDVIYHEDTFHIKNLFLGYDENSTGKIYVFAPILIDSSIAGYMMMKHSSNAFKRRLYFDFSNSVGNALKKYQRQLSDFNKTIKIQEQASEFLRQTVEALATAVDAKDKYTHGHSNRVAYYSRKIAQESGMTDAECDDVYLAGLLHDVGKILIDDNILNKDGRLTNEEFAAIKLHPGFGGQILSKIVASPSLSVGAHHHHERYDGNGYPDKLKADDIPQIARIIAVADAYDAMTSKRSYRDTIPRESVREELVKGIGTQFDPEYARIMIKFLDQDVEYKMRESHTEEVFGADLSYQFDNYKSKVSVGARITECPVSIKMKYKPLKDGGQPTLLFYDSADERYYLKDNKSSREMDFVDYASIAMDGRVSSDYIRKIEHKVTGEENVTTENAKNYEADIFMVKQDDHLFVRITTNERTDEFTFAMHDASRYVYVALTGEFCTLDILDVDISDNEVEADYISRIDEKISYIGGPVGDIPNVQIDGWVSNHSEILKLDSDIELSFHTMSLPSSRRIWHCPIVGLFASDDGKIGGSNFRELAFIRLDGEVWTSDPGIVNESSVTELDEFENWVVWKQKNKAGVDCNLKISRIGDVLNLYVENSGLETRNQTKIPLDASNLYLYFTGDQCALTNIRISKE